MEKISIGVIGAGWWATAAHIPGVKSHPGAELVAVQSRERENALRIANDFGAKHACTTVAELLGLPTIAAVIISSTPNVHYQQAKAALDSGRHVLLEKPMTLTVAEAFELVGLAAKKKLQLHISSPWHYTRHAIKAKQLIQSGALGKVKMISMLMTNPVHNLLRGVDNIPKHDSTIAYLQPCPGSYSDPSIAGGGQIYCQVSHAAAYLTFLTGSRAAEVFAHFDFDGSVNDIYDTLSLKMEDNTLVTIASTGATPVSERTYEIRVFGSAAILQLELWRGTMKLIGFDDERTEFPVLTEDEIYPAQAPASNFIDSILGKSSNVSSGELGLASMEVIEAACISARTGELQIIRPVCQVDSAKKRVARPPKASIQNTAAAIS
jgi:predicted dehydrogenase